MRTDVANTFRDTAALFVTDPTLHRREYLALLCEALSPDEAWQLLDEICRAYDQERAQRAPWLQAPRSLAILFDVGDLIDRLSDAVDAFDVRERQTRREAAVARSASDRKLHLEHVEAIEAERQRAAVVKRECAADFEAVRSRDFEDCMGTKSRTVLAATDAHLARQPPVWWADVGVEACPPQVQRALVHRLRQLLAARGSASLPSAMHATLNDVERRLQRRAKPSDSASSPPPPRPAPLPSSHPRRRWWSWEDASIRPLLRTVWRRVRWSIFPTSSSK